MSDESPDSPTRDDITRLHDCIRALLHTEDGQPRGGSPADLHLVRPGPLGSPTNKSVDVNFEIEGDLEPATTAPQEDAASVPTEAELIRYAEFIGFDLDAEKDLLWIAAQGLTAPLPPHVTLCEVHPHGQVYFNAQTRKASYVHPVDVEMNALLERERGTYKELRVDIVASREKQEFRGESLTVAEVEKLLGHMATIVEAVRGACSPNDAPFTSLLSLFCQSARHLVSYAYTSHCALGIRTVQSLVELTEATHAAQRRWNGNGVATSCLIAMVTDIHDALRSAIQSRSSSDSFPFEDVRRHVAFLDAVTQYKGHRKHMDEDIARRVGNSVDILLHCSTFAAHLLDECPESTDRDRLAVARDAIGSCVQRFEAFQQQFSERSPLTTPAPGSPLLLRLHRRASAASEPLEPLEHSLNGSVRLDMSLTDMFPFVRADAMDRCGDSLNEMPSPKLSAPDNAQSAFTNRISDLRTQLLQDWDLDAE